MKTLSKYSLFLLTAYAAIVVIAAVFVWDGLLLTQKCVVVITVVVTLHEWEEQRFPGGFFDLMTKKMGITATPEQMTRMLAKPDLLMFVLTALALVAKDVAFFSIAAIFFGIVEGLVHIAGIKLVSTEKPYTPGMITGVIYAVVSIVSIVLLAQHGTLGAIDWILGALWLIVCFVVMELSVWRAAGLNPSQIRERMMGMRAKGN